MTLILIAAVLVVIAVSHVLTWVVLLRLGVSVGEAIVTAREAGKLATIAKLVGDSPGRRLLRERLAARKAAQSGD